MLRCPFSEFSFQLVGFGGFGCAAMCVLFVNSNVQSKPTKPTIVTLLSGRRNSIYLSEKSNDYNYTRM